MSIFDIFIGVVAGIVVGEFLSEQVRLYLARRAFRRFQNAVEEVGEKIAAEVKKHDKLLRRSLRKAGVPVTAKKPKPWAKDWDRCIRCHRTDRRHQARGCCHTCYQIVFVKPKRCSRRP